MSSPPWCEGLARLPPCKIPYQKPGRWEHKVPRSPPGVALYYLPFGNRIRCPTLESRDSTARKPSSRSCHHTGWRTAGSFGARPPRREQLFPVIGASQGSKCALLQPLAGSQLSNSFSLILSLHLRRKITNVRAHIHIHTRPSFFTQENHQ